MKLFEETPVSVTETAPGILRVDFGNIEITPRGPVLIDWENGLDFVLSLELPEGMSAKVDVPAAKGSTGILINGVKAVANSSDGRWLPMDMVSGKVRIEVK